MHATRTLRREDLPENAILNFEATGTRYVVADVDGEVRAYAVSGPAAARVDRSVVAEGALRCPRHGWAIDRDGGGCGAADLCRYERVPVRVEGAAIRVGLR
jgi:nitrite reductase/ring-hydroxylating ferredoxin subunit